MIVSDRLFIHISPRGNLATELAGFRCRRAGAVSVGWVGDDAPASGDGVIDALDTFAAETASSAPQIFNRITLRDGALTITSDPLGLKPLYIAEDDGEIFLASRLLDLVRLRPAVARPLDRESFLALLVFGHLFDEQTLHQRIRRLPADSATTWSAEGGLRTTPTHCLMGDLPDLKGTLTDILLDDIDTVIGAHLRALPTAPEQRPVIALSGGFDSRIVAAKARALDIPLEAFSYGHWRDRDVVIARWIARRLKLDYHLLPYPEDVLRRHRSLFLDVSEGQGDPALLQITNLLSLPHPPGTVLLHGFGGGSLFGDNVSDWMLGGAQDRSALAGTIVKKGGIATTKADAIANALDLAADTLVQQVAATFETESYPYHHQALMAWDLKNRQRRFIGVHFDLLGRRFKVRAPFYDLRLMKLCMALPVGLLEERLLDRLYLRNFFPRLAQIPHDQEVAPILPDLKDEFILALIDKILRPTNIWQRTHGRTDAQAQRLMTASTATLSAVLRDTWRESVDLPADALADERVRKRAWSFVDYTQRLAEVV